MDTRTGEILALADYPSFDATNAALRGRRTDLGSPALSDVYEPGSVEKVLTAAALIDAGMVNPLTRLPGARRAAQPGDRVVHDYFDHDMLRYTLAGIIAKSSNIGTVLAARQFGRGQLYHYLDRSGSASAPTSACHGETPGLLAAELWTDMAHDNIAFGQGVVGQRRADGRRDQHDRQRRRPRAAEPGQGPGDHVRRHGRRLRPRRAAPGGQRDAPPG